MIRKLLFVNFINMTEFPAHNKSDELENLLKIRFKNRRSTYVTNCVANNFTNFIFSKFAGQVTKHLKQHFVDAI